MRKLIQKALICAAFALALSSASGTRAEDAPIPWSRLSSSARRDVAASQPLAVLVYVPLCSNAQINCGASWAGQPSGLGTNIYWGAQYGARRFLERAGSGWEKVAENRPERGPVLEEVVFRRWLSGSAWKRTADERVEQIAVLRAVHGSRINDAVADFWQAATRGAEVSFVDGERRRSQRIHVVGYAGHNRLLDGLRLPDAAAPSEHALPSFVLACYSDRYFSEPLRKAGSQPLVTTRTYMAPEGYVIEAVLSALGDNLPLADVRQRAVDAYAKWQRLRPAQADWIFAPATSAR